MSIVAEPQITDTWLEEGVSLLGPLDEPEQPPLLPTIPSQPGAPCFAWAEAYKARAEQLRDAGQHLAALQCDRLFKCMRYASSLIESLPVISNDVVAAHATAAAHTIASMLVAAGSEDGLVLRAIDALKDQFTQMALLGRAVTRLEERNSLKHLDEMEVQE